MRELRHDFRMYYHTPYDQVSTDEAIDLIATLPRGSLYVAKKHPEAAWSEIKESTADLCDCIVQMACLMRGVDNAPRVTRPADLVARSKAAQKNKEVQKKLREIQG